MQVGFWKMVGAAFNARPLGMFVPPNWIGLAAFGLLGLVNPGFWALGAGLELGYLFTLVSSKRFQRTVRASHQEALRAQGQSKISGALSELGETERKRYGDLERYCQAILRQQQSGDASLDLMGQGEGLGRLLWVYLRLLLTRQSIRRTLSEGVKSELKYSAAARGAEAEPSEGADPGCRLLEGRIRDLEEKLRGGSGSEEVRKSLAGQVEILQQRLKSRREALEKLAFLDAELVRIEEQVKLIRDQVSVAADPTAVSSRIDQIAAGLGGTAQWVRDQQQVYGLVDLLEEPPPLAVPRKEARKEAQ